MQADEPPGREAALEAEVAVLRAQLAALQRQSAREAYSFHTPPSKLTRAGSQHSLAEEASPLLAGPSTALVSAVEKVAGNSQKTLHAFFASPGSSPGGALPSASGGKRREVGLSPPFLQKAEQAAESAEQALAALRPSYLAAKQEERKKAKNLPKRRVRNKSSSEAFPPLLVADLPGSLVVKESKLGSERPNQLLSLIHI